MSADRRADEVEGATSREPRGRTAAELPALRVFARLTLSYNGVEYNSQWLEYPDIAPTLKAFGLERNRDGEVPYMIPAVRFEDGGRALDSSRIVRELEKRYPTASPKVEDTLVHEVVEAVIQCMKAAPDVLPKVPRVLVDPQALDGSGRTRLPKSALSLDQLGKARAGSSKEAADLGFKRAAELLKEHREGPYFMGRKVSYADFVFASLLKFLERADRDMFERALAFDPVLKQNYDACAQWFLLDER